MEDLSDIIAEFLVESHENLDQLDQDLVGLEREPGSRELISRIFRTIHTIKGTSGFLAFGRLERLTHAGESLLARLRDGVQPVAPATITALLQMIDGVRDLLAAIERTGSEGEGSVDDLIVLLHAEMSGADAGRQVGERTAEAVTGERIPAPEPEPAADTAGVAPATGAAGVEPAGGAAGVEPADGTAGVEPADGTAGVEPADGTAAPERTGGGPDSDDGGPAEPARAPRRSVGDSVVRVDVNLLDSLLNLVGELVLARNQLVRRVTEGHDATLVRNAQRLGMITSELQEGIMKTRMQPIDHIWSKLPRVVRDLSGALGKQVRLVMHGKETELDRSLLEAVKDPLTHLVRNAVDHGIEDPQRRLVAGKTAEGVLTLRAYHEGGHVTVEVADDGAGLDVDRIAQKAIEKGLVRPDQVAQMEEREILTLVFQPGFSTAQKITNVSGRGVGMDVVKTNIERIGGTVSVDSTPGQGAVWRLTIPLTLAIIQALILECGDQRYVVPQVSVHELVYIDGQSARIEYAAGAPLYRLRGNLLPLVRLNQALGMTPGGDEGVYVMVLQADSRRFGLVVDRVLNTEEVVVKPLNNRLKNIGLYAGATILGDGKVGLILDVPSLARRSHLGVRELERDATPQVERKLGAGASENHVLVVAVGDRRVSIPLDAVTRLEEFPRDRIERAGSREVVQYNGQIMSLVRLAGLLGTSSDEAGTTVSAVVCSAGSRSVALVVDRILDIAEDAAATHRDVEDAGLVGTAVIQQRVTELLDVRQAILAADPNFYRDRSGQSLVEA